MALTAKQAARDLAVSHSTVLRLAHAGALSVFQLRQGSPLRINPDSVIAYAESHPDQYSDEQAIALREKYRGVC